MSPITGSCKNVRIRDPKRQSRTFMDENVLPSLDPPNEHRVLFTLMMSLLARVRQFLLAIILVLCTASGVVLPPRAAGAASTNTGIIQVVRNPVILQFHALFLFPSATHESLRPINLNGCSHSVAVLVERSASCVRIEDRSAEFTGFAHASGDKSSFRNRLSISRLRVTV